MKDYPHLFAPITLGNTKFRNRILAAPIGLEYYENEHLHPQDSLIAFFEKKAQGGAASVCIGSVMADNARGAVGPTMRLDDPTAIAPLYRLSQCISRHGAVADIELQHCGGNAYHSMLSLGNEIYGAVDMVNGLGFEIKAMPEEVIFDTIEKFGDAAQVAKHCGFGMVTVHAGHGWLFNQFLGPDNTRTDEWGGASMDNRARFVRAIAENIKKKCGRGFPVNIRISGTECTKDGYDIEYGVEIAKALDGYFDMINVSVGAHEAPPAVFTHTHPSMFLEDGVNVQFAAAAKKVVKDSKIAAVGALAMPNLMEEIIASGQADVVMLCRELIADPDMPIKAMTNKGKDVRKCIRCFECFSGHFTHLSNRCAINPEIGFEREVRYAEPEAKVKKKVAVIGGGVGGMQAALSASERGHSVVLFEKEEELGGALRCEKRVSFKQNLQYYLDQQARYVAEDPRIELHLNTEATPEAISALKPDVVIAAVGAEALVPPLPGLDRDNVLPVEYAFLHEEEIGNEVVVLGGGLSGIEMAIHLGKLGKKVTVVEMADTLNFAGNIIHSMAITGEVEKYGIQIATSTRAVEITDEGVKGEFVGSTCSLPPACETIQKGILQSVVTLPATGWDEGTELGAQNVFKADTVIYAFGQKPLCAEADAFSDCALQFFQIGDCVEAKNVYTTNSVAYTIARDLGKC